MKITRPKHLYKDERVVAIDPSLSTYVSEQWNRRLNFYSGRTLTHTALNIEQKHHNSHLALYGGQLSAGTVYGLELSVDAIESPTDPGVLIDHFRIEAGLGISVFGEDVTLAQPLIIEAAKVPVVGQDPNDSTPANGFGVLVLQPIVADSAGEYDDTDPCEIDPRNDAFDNWQIADGCRIAWYPWPSSWPIPLPPYGERIRNRLAYFVYGQELSLNGKPLPWENVGVPLALGQIANDGSVLFVDRYAVVRQGGAPKPRNTLLENTGSPFLWQARILGLTAHMQELQDQGLELSEAINYFQFLPPVGVLPPGIVDLTTNQGSFLPSQYTIEAAPVPLEQFELAVKASAALEPFDLFVPDRIKVLIPVPQAVYEPRLLKRESVDPIFEETISSLLEQLISELGKRLTYRLMGNSVLGAIDKDLIIEYPDPDPDEVPGEYPGTDYSIDEDHAFLARTEIQTLYDWLQEHSPLSDTERNQINPDNLGSDEFIGVQQLIDDLQDKVDRSNHSIDFGFLRLQTDIYRMRQIMLGSVKASRLATSPVLADIAKSETNYATQQNLQDYFSQVTPYSATVGMSSGEGGSSAASVASGVMSHRAAAPDIDSREFSSPASRDIRSRRLADPKAYYAAEFPADLAVGTPPVSTPEAAAYIGTTAASYLGTSDDIEEKSPIIGEPLEFRSTTIADRMIDPPAPEARSYAVATKAAVISSLAELPINIDGIEVPLSGSESAVVPLPEYQEWYKKLTPSDGEAAVMLQRARGTDGDVVIYVGPFTDAERKTLGDREAHLRVNLNQFVGVNKRALSTTGLSGLIMSGAYDPHPTDGDESSFLSVGVSALESAVSALRRIERRVNGYKIAISQCKKTLKQLYLIRNGWSLDLGDSDQRVAELRHDVTVARSLFEEEQSRINAINERRREILENYVSFVGYVRARSESLRNDMPSVQLHGVFEDPVPACLKQDAATPDELADMLDLFRDVPLKWLPFTQLLILKFDRPDFIRTVYQQAKAKATLKLQLSQNTVAAANPKSSSKYGQTVQHLLAAHKQANFGYVQQKASYNLQLLEPLTWKEVTTKAQDELSLEDLIESGKGKSSLAQRAAKEMENVENVATCFYNRCGDVPPSVRLLWADELSVFDSPVIIQELEVLPGWETLDYELRQDLQRLVQWLFSRINKKIPDALALMNDLVRVCILLASHAPVSAIINGHVPEPATGKIGDVIDLVVDKGMARIGMIVGIYSGTHMMVQGVVENLSQQAATIKVTQSKEVTYQITQGAKAQFFTAGAQISIT